MFRFKQFIVHDDRCAMKVGTDGVLLGAWADVSFLSGSDAKSAILDIGTGSGLIALMLAQRTMSDTHIFAIDIDSDAVSQASENFSASPWSSRLHARNLSLQDIDSREFPDSSFSLIVSNPPYFVDSLKNPDLGRQTARHTDTLNYEDLISCSARLLCPDGQLALILPAEAESVIIRLAESHHLYPLRICHVHGSARKPAKRVMIQFLKLPLPSPVVSQLILMDEKGARSTAYATLCQDFYL